MLAPAMVFTLTCCGRLQGTDVHGIRFGEGSAL
jgi:hypothetical protein